MLRPIESFQSPYKKKLQQIAKISEYQPIASIPQPSDDFNYTISRNRYSEYYQSPKVIKKRVTGNKEQLKLATILQTHGRSPLFPKIGKKKNNSGQGNIGSSKCRVKGLRSHFKKDQQTTVTSRERSLTIDTRLDTEEDKKNANLSQCFEGVNNYREKSESFDCNSAQRNKKCISNSSELSVPIDRRKKGHNSSYAKSELVYSDFILKEENQEQEDDQYEKDAVPGPGSYDYRYSDFDKKLQTRSTNASFLSKLTRFNYSAKKQEPAFIQINPIQAQKQQQRQEKLRSKSIKKKPIPFNSLSPRKFEVEASIKKIGPGPQDYYPRQGIQQELIRVIQRQFRSNFGSNQERLTGIKSENPNIGPGCYQQPSKQDPLAGQNFYFKSRKQRFDQ